MARAVASRQCTVIFLWQSLVSHHGRWCSNRAGHPERATEKSLALPTYPCVSLPPKSAFAEPIQPERRDLGIYVYLYMLMATPLCVPTCRRWDGRSKPTHSASHARWSMLAVYMTWLRLWAFSPVVTKDGRKHTNLPRWACRSFLTSRPSNTRYVPLHSRIPRTPLSSALPHAAGSRASRPPDAGMKRAAVGGRTGGPRG